MPGKIKMTGLKKLFSPGPKNANRVGTELREKAPPPPQASHSVENVPGIIKKANRLDSELREKDPPPQKTDSRPVPAPRKKKTLLSGNQAGFSSAFDSKNGARGSTVESVGPFQSVRKECPSFAPLVLEGRSKKPNLIATNAKSDADGGGSDSRFSSTQFSVETGSREQSVMDIANGVESESFLASSALKNKFERSQVVGSWLEDQENDGGVLSGGSCYSKVLAGQANDGGVLSEGSCSSGGLAGQANDEDVSSRSSCSSEGREDQENDEDVSSRSSYSSERRGSSEGTLSRSAPKSEAEKEEAWMRIVERNPLKKGLFRYKSSQNLLDGES